MPANLPPDYYAAERRFRAAKDIQEKVEILREMLRIMPKHKGTDHLQADLKRKIAKFNSEAQKKKGASRQSAYDHIEREGAGQIVLAGGPNTGKSSLVSQLTHAKPDVADFPYSTFKPVCGMLNHQDIQMQVVDLPPIADHFTEVWVYNVIRISDVVLWVVDLSDDKITEQMNRVEACLSEHRIRLCTLGEKRPQGAEALKTTVLAGTKAETDPAGTRWERCLAALKNPMKTVRLSVQAQTGTESLGQALFDALEVVRIYTKTPGRDPDMLKPYILPCGSTVSDAAMTIHKDLADHMRFARIWGSEKYEGQRVNRDHVLEDGDILEIHTN
ncbi:TGS domain-containing protein [bacterium]|nr:TGS domain-containing protein [bacterium]